MHSNSRLVDIFVDLLSIGTGCRSSVWSPSEFRCTLRLVPVRGNCPAQEPRLWCAVRGLISGPALSASPVAVTGLRPSAAPPRQMMNESRSRRPRQAATSHPPVPAAGAPFPPRLPPAGLFIIGACPGGSNFTPSTAPRGCRRPRQSDQLIFHSVDVDSAPAATAGRLLWGGGGGGGGGSVDAGGRQLTAEKTNAEQSY